MQELARSTDGGETWLMVDSPAERPTAMLFGNGQFLIVEGTNLRYTSTDGLNWRPLHFTGDGTFSLFFEMGVFGGDEFVLGALDYRILLKTRGGGRELLFGGAGRKDLALFHRNDGEWVYGFLLPQDYPIDGFEVLHHTNSLSPEDTLREIPEIIRSFHGSPDGAWNLWGVRVSDIVPYDRGILRVSGP
jgi:hypothetical protein